MRRGNANSLRYSAFYGQEKSIFVNGNKKPAHMSDCNHLIIYTYLLKTQIIRET